METKKCSDCGRMLPLTAFMTTRYGNSANVCKECIREKKMATRKEKKISRFSTPPYSDPEYDGKTPREVQEILTRAARWLNHQQGFTCDVSLRYEKTIRLDVH